MNPRLDAPSSTEHLRTIQRITRIVESSDVGFEQQLDEVLALGLELFDLDIAIVARIEQDAYSIHGIRSNLDVPLKPGDELSLGETYCRDTVAANRPVCFEIVDGTSRVSHPAYAAFKLESYIGVPVFVRGTSWGTLNFSSPDPRPRRFRAEDICLLSLLAAWVGSCLDLIGQRLQATREVTETRERHSSLEQLAQSLAEANSVLALENRLDTLTGVMTRGAWDEALRLEHERAVRDGESYAVMMIDIDHFKGLNDSLGHQAGDACLKRVAESLLATAAPIGFVGRYGGEEFCVLLPEHDVGAGLAVADQVRRAILQCEIPHPAHDSSTIVTASIGVSGGPAEGYHGVVAAADRWMYQAKNGGRDRVCAADRDDATDDKTGLEPPVVPAPCQTA